jgi:hypothetical protein
MKLINAFAFIVIAFAFTSCCPKVLQTEQTTSRVTTSDTIYLRDTIEIPTATATGLFDSAKFMTICDSILLLKSGQGIEITNTETNTETKSVPRIQTIKIVKDTAGFFRIQADISSYMAEIDSLRKVITTKDSVSTITTKIIAKCVSKFHRFTRTFFWLFLALFLGYILAKIGGLKLP